MNAEAPLEAKAQLECRPSACQLPGSSGRSATWPAANRTFASAINRFERAASGASRRTAVSGALRGRLSTHSGNRASWIQRPIADAQSESELQ